MCTAKLYKSGKPNSRIDDCMRRLIELLVSCAGHLKIRACCCGHNRYKMTIVVEDVHNGHIYELMTGLLIMRKRKFYKKDKQGYYYIPEVDNEQTTNS